MNVSDKHKLIFIAPARTASRAISHVFWKELQFINLYDGMDAHTHEVCYDHEKYKDYKILITVRNPYSKQVSAWQMEYWDHGRKDYEFFDCYIKNNSLGYMYTEHSTLDVCNKFNKTISYVIKYENMIEDLLKIDIVKNNQDCLNKINFLLENKIKSSNIDRLPEENGRFSNYKKYYTQELADLVYNQNELIFKTFGYEKDSWK